MHLVRGDPLAAPETFQLDQEPAADHFAAELFHRFDLCACRTPGGDQVVVHQNPGSVRECVGVHFKRVESVLEFVIDRNGFRWQLAGFSGGDEPGIEGLRQSTSENEAPRLGRDDEIRLQRSSPLNQVGSDRTAGRRVEQQRRDVAKEDSGLGEVLDGPDQGGVVNRHAAGAYRRLVIASGMIRRMDFSGVDLRSLLLDTEAAVAMKAHGKTEAAVLMPIMDWPEAPRLIFTERRADLRKHAGEISFPGGTADPEDENLEDTALRESEEEIALHRVHVEVVGAVPPIGTFVTGFRVQPIVGLVSSEATMMANPDEVATILSFSFEELVDSYAMRRLVRRGVPIRTPTFELDRHLIWGATGRILTDFLHRIGAFT